MKRPNKNVRTSASNPLKEDGARKLQSPTPGQIYANPAAQHDEAIRSASLAAMTLVLAAEARGLVSGPMIGFDPEGVKREFQITERYLPVMLIAVGYPAPGNRPRKPRLPLSEVLVQGTGASLP